MSDRMRVEGKLKAGAKKADTNQKGKEEQDSYFYLQILRDG
jgi:hypothetical protein